MPPSLVEREYFPDHLKIAYDCFHRLKNMSIEAGLVDFTQVRSYLEMCGVTNPDEILRLYDVVRALDTERIIYLSEQRREETSEE